MAELLKPTGLSKIWANDGEIHQPTDSKIDLGWVKEIPTYQDFNFLQNKTEAAIAHNNQHGINLWDPITEYRANQSYVQGSDGYIYFCKTTHTNVNPTTESPQVNWKTIIRPDSVSRIDIPAVNGYSQSLAPEDKMKASVINGVLYISGAIGTPGGSPSQTFGVLPVGYRPTISGARILGYYTTSNLATAFRVNNDGTLVLDFVTPSSFLTVSGAIPL